MTVIKSGSNGNVLEINADNQAEVSSETKNHDHVKNEQLGTVWSLSFENIDPTGANDYFFYLKNTGTVNIEITDIRITSTVAGQLAINKVSGTASSGTTVTPVSKNTSKTVSPTATIETDPDITGLTSEGTWYYYTLEADKFFKDTTSSRIIIGPTGAVALLWEPATGILSGTVSINVD